MSRPRPTASLLLVGGLLAAVIGVVAAVLVQGEPTPPAQHAGEVVVDLPPTVWGLLFLSPIITGIGALLLHRGLTDRGPRRLRLVVLPALVFIAFALLLTYAIVFASSTPFGTVSVVGSPPATPTNTSLTNGSGGGSGSGAPASAVSVQIPVWVLVTLAIGFAVVVGVLALPGTLGRLLDRRSGFPSPGRHRPVDPARVRAALGDASAAIQQGGDPRETIVRLYGRLLREVTPRVGDLDCLTAEEIRVAPLRTLNVRPDAAEALTRLFERARYSTQPMGPPEAGRCLDALRAVEADLARAPATR